MNYKAWEIGEIIKLLTPRPGEKILDIGCNVGDLCNMLKLAHSVQPTGIDINGVAISIANEKYPGIYFEESDILNINKDFPGFGQYDGITLVQVIEHITDPEAGVQICNDLLKPGGRIVLTTINKWAYFNKMICLLTGKKFIFYQDPSHITQFDPRMIRSILERNGFEVEKIGTVSTAFNMTIPTMIFGIILYALAKKA